VTTAFVNRHAAAEKARVEAEDARRAEEARIAADKRIAAEKAAAEARARAARAEAAHATEIRARKAAEARALAAEAEAKQRAADLKRREDRQRKAEQEDAAKRAVKDRGRLSEQVYKLAKLLPGAAASPLRMSAPEAFRESWQHLNGLVAEAIALADNLRHATTGMSPARWEQIQRERAEKERRT